MKSGTAILIILLTATFINPVIAGHRHGHNYRGHGLYYSHGYGPRIRHGHYGFHGYHAAIALGGLIVGGILGATIAESYNRNTYRSNYSQPAYSNSYRTNHSVPATYMMQPNGICYVVSHVNNGSLVLSPTSPGHCR